MSLEPGQAGIPYTAEAPPVQIGPGGKKKFDWWKAADTLEIILRYTHAGLRGVIEAHTELEAKKGPEHSQEATNNLAAMAGGQVQPVQVSVPVQIQPKVSVPPAQVRAPRR